MTPKVKEIKEDFNFMNVFDKSFLKYVAAYSEQAWQANKAIEKLEKKYINNEEVSKDINEFLDAFLPMVDTYNELAGIYLFQELLKTQERRD